MIYTPLQGKQLSKLLRQFLFEPLDSLTLTNMENIVKVWYKDDVLDVKATHSGSRIVDIMLVFETEEDAVVFKLKYGE